MADERIGIGRRSYRRRTIASRLPDTHISIRSDRVNGTGRTSKLLSLLGVNVTFNVFPLATNASNSSSGTTTRRSSSIDTLLRSLIAADTVRCRPSEDRLCRIFERDGLGLSDDFL